MEKGIVFGTYDKQELDAQYNNRERVAGTQQWIEKWTAQSAVTRNARGGTYDIAYGDHPAETLDIFPAAEPDAPVTIFVHGGYWHLLDKSDFSYVANGFVPHGVTTVIINYALAPGVDMDDIVRQVRAAVSWTYLNAHHFGADRERIHVSGHSAGGHLVAMLLATDWPRADFDLPGNVVKAGAAISGLFDLEPIRLCYLNEVLGMDEAMAVRNSPVHLAYPVEAPLLIAVGGLESEEYHRQAHVMEAVWRDHDYPVTMMAPPGLDHFSIADGLGVPDSTIVEAQLPYIPG